MAKNGLTTAQATYEHGIQLLDQGKVKDAKQFLYLAAEQDIETNSHAAKVSFLVQKCRASLKKCGEPEGTIDQRIRSIWDSVLNPGGESPEDCD